MDRPRGKESTEVWKSQIKGKESENSYQELKRSIERLRKTAVLVEISRYNFRVFVCAYPSVISSIPGKSFHFPFTQFVIFKQWVDIDISGKSLHTLEHKEAIAKFRIFNGHAVLLITSREWKLLTQDIC